VLDGTSAPAEERLLKALQTAALYIRFAQ